MVRYQAQSLRYCFGAGTVQRVDSLSAFGAVINKFMYLYTLQGHHSLQSQVDASAYRVKWLHTCVDVQSQLCSIRSSVDTLLCRASWHR